MYISVAGLIGIIVAIRILLMSDEEYRDWAESFVSAIFGLILWGAIALLMGYYFVHVLAKFS